MVSVELIKDIEMRTANEQTLWEIQAYGAKKSEILESVQDSISFQLSSFFTFDWLWSVGEFNYFSFMILRHLSKFIFFSYKLLFHPY